MSAHKSIPANVIQRKSVPNKVQRTSKDKANTIALGIILIVITMVIMAGALIFMSLSGSSGELILLVGVVPFIAIFLLLLLAK